MKVGDVVILKSNVGLSNFGPKMTVEKYNKNSVDCVWFDESGVIHYQTFPPEALIVENRGDLGENILLG